jgi:hypothetical protein
MTDFVEWLDANEPDNFEEVYALYQAVHDTGTWGPYEGQRDARGRVFVKGSNPPSLALVSEAAIAAFVRLLQRRYMDGDGPDSLSPDGWYNFTVAMAKDDD